jgi:hypothetical protein
MNSIAIWWSCKNGATLDVHIDINVWFANTKKNSNYIEFGLKLSNRKNIDALYIFLPFVVEKEEIEDKVESLVKDKQLTNALFNEPMNIGVSEGSFHKVEYTNENGEQMTFRYCQLNYEEDLVVDKVTDNKRDDAGTKLTIKLKDKHVDEIIYYRFRINNQLEELTRTSDENLFFLDGLFKKIRFIELCLNNNRKLPNTIVDNLSSQNKFKSMNLFFMTDTFTNFIFESKPVHGTRILERHIWNGYLGNDHSDSNIIANHWKAENFHDYNLFVKIKYLHKNSGAFILTILVVIFMGALSGVIGNYFTEWIQKGSVSQAADSVNDKQEVGNEPTKH